MYFKQFVKPPKRSQTLFKFKIKFTFNYLDIGSKIYMIKEAESSLKIPTTFCSVHQDRSVLSVCLEESCTYRGMFCYQCIKFHYAHLEKTFEIKEFLNSVSEHINELSFDMLPTTPSVSLKELYRHRYEQFSHNKENLLRQKESITEAISKYVNLAIDSAEKKMQGVEVKNNRCKFNLIHKRILI